MSSVHVHCVVETLAQAKRPTVHADYISTIASQTLLGISRRCLTHVWQQQEVQPEPDDLETVNGTNSKGIKCRPPMLWLDLNDHLLLFSLSECEKHVCQVQGIHVPALDLSCLCNAKTPF